ncbi:hypothetical protein TNCV_2283451 [Trichonephila clavipes]|nr:hypothetical protein TNCV_2283451 [Trichonephila clavipes]
MGQDSRRPKARLAPTTYPLLDPTWGPKPDFAEVFCPSCLKITSRSIILSHQSETSSLFITTCLPRSLHHPHQLPPKGNAHISNVVQRLSELINILELILDDDAGVPPPLWAAPFEPPTVF